MQRLKFGTTSTFELKWNDRGSGANMDGAFYRPIPEAGFFVIGDYGQDNYSEPRGTVITVTEIDPDPANPLLKPPVGFAQIWNDKGSGADRDGSFWQPLPPNGYVALGCVSQTGYKTPSVADYRCLRLDQVKLVETSSLIWNDRGSGADEDVSVYRISVTNVIHAQDNYDPPQGPFYVPKDL